MSNLNFAPDRQSHERTRRPTTAAQVLRDLLADHGISQETLALAIGVSRLSVSQLVNDRRSVTAEMALRLSVATGTTPDFWLDLQRAADLFDARQKLGDTLLNLRPVIDCPEEFDAE